MQTKTQRDRILGVLIQARGQWVELPEIMECAAQYNARLFELRRLGFRIENRIRDVGGVRHSWFRLIPAPERLTIPRPCEHRAAPDKRLWRSQDKSNQPNSASAVQQPLFADRHVDE